MHKYEGGETPVLIGLQIYKCQSWNSRTQFDEERVTLHICPSPLRCQSLRDFLVFHCGYQQEWVHVLFVPHRPQLQNPREEHIPEVGISYKHFREQPSLRGVRKTNKAKLTAEWVVLRARSRIAANVHWMVHRAFPVRADGQTTIIRQRTGANVKKFQSVPKKLSLLHGTTPFFLCIPSSQLPSQETTAFMPSPL